MAVTIHQQPPTHAPGFNDLIYVVSSTNTAQTNFQYLCDIYLTDDTGALSHAGRTYLREKAPVDPTYSSGVFNITNHIKSYLSYDIHGSSGSIQKCPNSNLQIVCKFGEEYGASSAVTQYADLTNASTVIAFNAVFDFADFNDYAVATYTTPSTNTTARFLTNRPANGIIRSDEDAWLYKHCSASNEANYIVYKRYDASNVVINPPIKVYNPYTQISTVGRYTVQIPAGPRNINQIPENDIVGASDVQPIIIDGTVYSYDVYTENASNNQTSEAQHFVISSECTDKTIYRLHFLNKLGGFDSFSFIRAHTFETDIKKETFKRNVTTRIGGGRYGYNKYDLSDVQYLTTNKDVIKVTADWIDEDTSEWLEELATAPVAFHDDPTHGLIAINIKESKYTRKQWVTDKLFNFELTFTYGYDRYRQTL